MARNEFGIMKAKVTATLHDSSLTSLVGDWLNTAIQIIHNKTSWQFLQVKGALTTVASQQEYGFTSVASDVDKVLWIVSTDPSTAFVELSEIDLRQFDPQDTQEGDPLVYYVRDETIGLWPIPSSVKTYVVGYKKLTVDLSGDGDIPDIPLRWTDVIESGAEMLGWKYLNGPGDPNFVTASQYFDGRIQDMLGNMQKKPQKRHRMGSPQEHARPHILRIPNTELD